MHKIKITSPGWETYSGPLAGGTMFENGVSVGLVSVILSNRIGASLQIVDVETGDQLGPAAALQRMHAQSMTVAEYAVTADVAQREKEAQDAERARLEKLEADAEARRVASEVEALEAAREKAAAETPQVYTRLELEELGKDKGIQALRDIAEPIGAKGRSVNELVVAILRKQGEKLSA